MEAWVAWLMELFRSEHIEFALFAAAFISATVLPGGSEAVLAGAVAGTPSRVVEFVLIAMLGNALGGMTGCRSLAMRCPLLPDGCVSRRCPVFF